MQQSPYVGRVSSPKNSIGFPTHNICAGLSDDTSFCGDCTKLKGGTVYV